MAGKGRPVVNRVGHVYGRLTVLRMDETRGIKQPYWVCCCECGKEAVVRGASLQQGATRSCGCLVRDSRVSPITDRVGQVFGRLTVLELAEGRTAGGGVRWLCRCECGTEKVINSNSMVSGTSLSCGCLQRERAFRTHGMTDSVERQAWSNMKARCLNPNLPRYVDYGGRGITVCQRWLDSFENFYKDVGPRPDGMSLDRVDVDGDYEPGNVKWSSASEQQQNKRPYVRATKGDLRSLQSELDRQAAEIERLKAALAERQ